MSIFENAPSVPAKEKVENDRGKTPRRLMNLLPVWAQLVNKIELSGREHLAEIPKDKKLIFATSHITDLDVLATTYKLGDDFDLAIANQSIHHKFTQEWPTNIGLRLAGKKNFLPVDYVKGAKKKEARFNPENFVPMEEAMENGKAIVMAAHNPSQTGIGLEKGGVGAVYLAQLVDAVIVPVAVNLKSEKAVGMYGESVKTLLARPDVEVMVGKPMQLEKIKNIEFIAQAMAKRKGGEILSKEEISEFENVVDQLQAQSDEVSKKIAQMLPENKRGPYTKAEETL